MYKTIFNKRTSLKFKHFSNKGYSLFSVLGREVIVGTLSVATLTYAKANGISTEVSKITTDSLYRGAALELDEVSVTASRAPL
ncbi:MAG: TonB-dependent receptor, partial [Prevotella sp.]|nr:TonB-dependent receptor [Prevotella sp.]